LEYLAFFQEDGSRLNVEEIEVKKDVPPPIFTEFVKFLEGHPIEITEETYSVYRSLSKDFGFEALSTKCDLFEESHRHLSKDSELREKEILISRVCELEERQEFLEREIATLSAVCRNFENRLSEQCRLFESEQHYRRGCESFYGLNGLHGTNVSRQLGLSFLKSSADSGHSDAQYRYGHCLCSGEGYERNAVEAETISSSR
jgi:uncharacterized small protein (DUF1192 family)